MSARKYVAAWPKVKVSVGDKRVVVERGDEIPEGVSDNDLANLVSFGAIAGATGGSTEADVDEPDPTAGDLDLSKSAKDVLAWVGTDQDRARQALAAEQEAKGDKARKTLVEGLDAVLNPPPAE